MEKTHVVREMDAFACSLYASAFVYEDIARLIQSEHFNRSNTIRYCQSEAKGLRYTAVAYKGLSESEKAAYNNNHLQLMYRNDSKALKELSTPLLEDLMKHHHIQHRKRTKELIAIGFLAGILLSTIMFLLFS